MNFWGQKAWNFFVDNFRCSHVLEMESLLVIDLFFCWESSIEKVEASISANVSSVWRNFTLKTISFVSEFNQLLKIPQVWFLFHFTSMKIFKFEIFIAFGKLYSF